MSSHSIWMGFDISTSSSPILHPSKINYWQNHEFKNKNPEAPFYFKADALLGLSLIQLNSHLKNPFSSPKMNYPFANEAWLTLEPHFEIHTRTQPRLMAFKKHIQTESSKHVQKFESSFTEAINQSMQPWGVDLGELTSLIQAIDYLETNIEQPLLFNFKLKLEKTVTQKLHYLYSMLFHLRALIAMDYNAHIQDSAFEAIKIDSISDYLPKAEYVSNDSMMYWNFKRLKSEMPEATFNKIQFNFHQYSHNATCLIESIPNSYLQTIPAQDLEDTLYLIQMDWLFGTDSGLLFRVREELFGLLDGYENIFWPELIGKPHQPAHSLSVNCQLTEKDLNPTSAAA